MVGTTTVDFFLTGVERLPGAAGDEFAPASVAFLDRPPRMILGGNGANSAYVLAGLGTPASLCSAIGRDTLGGLVREWLGRRGVLLDGLVESERAATSTTTVALDRASNRLSLHHRGASPELTAGAVPDDLLSGARALLLTSYPLLTGLRPHGAAALLARSAGAGLVTALDVGPAIPPVADVKELAPLLRRTTYLLGNEHEIRACAGESDVGRAAAVLLAAGAGTVVVKRGGEGASAFTPARRVDAPGFPVRAELTVGAGDAFDAGFLHAVLAGRAADRALRFANAVAALVVDSGRGVFGSPGEAETEAFLGKNRAE